ncbi:hypothetical protein ALC56_04003 [Trachymyrmex septentrionalis]|uniref:Uncharacterized protein n=1 Tax=Trachymyrmex septentrionalis TaxID=34720 RepID=A0A151JYY7_9HYME|nr:hypothetical protein ALC56_04003 [Trachymyrmex septentrionalis]
MFAKIQRLNSITGVTLSLLLQVNKMNSNRVIPILLLLTLQGHPSKGIEKYTITQLDDNEVIYLETLNKIKLYHEQWKIGYDLTNLEKNYDKLSVAYTNLYQRYFLKLLNEENWTCSSKHLSCLAIYLTRLRRKTKTKRGLFDFVREISKTLFGTLADTDASYYNNELDKLYVDQKNIIQYVKNQTSIILKTLTGSGKAIEITSATIRNLNEQFNCIRDLSKANEANIRIDEALLNLDDELQKLTDDIRKIELIVDGRHETVKSYVLSPKELFNIFREHKHIDNFPVPINEIHYTTFIDISDISIALTQRRFIQCLIPLVKDKNLELTKVISLPRHGWLR